MRYIRKINKKFSKLQYHPIMSINILNYIIVLIMQITMQRRLLHNLKVIHIMLSDGRKLVWEPRTTHN